MIHDVIVIGAGPGGLAVAASLGRKRIRAVVLERSEGVGASWRNHYDRLHLHTPRRLSGLPGLEIPRRYGRWVSRGDVVRYLEEYAWHHNLDVRTGISVARVDRADGHWQLTDDAGERWTSRHVVVATGYNHTPVMPTWPGTESFTGTLIHANRYRNGAPYAGQAALVVGTGNTGCEIAQDLAESGAAAVYLSVRTPPYIVRRTKWGWPAQRTGIAVRRLPPRVVDRVAAVMQRIEVPDLTAYGLPKPTGGLYSRLLQGSVPVQDVGVVAAIESRTVLPVADVASFEGEEVVLTDGRRMALGVVVVAAGYRNGLAPLVGHLGVLRDDGRPVVRGAHTPPGAPGLWFTGYTNPISGMLRELAIDARHISDAIATTS